MPAATRTIVQDPFGQWRRFASTSMPQNVVELHVMILHSFVAVGVENLCASNTFLRSIIFIDFCYCEDISVPEIDIKHEKKSIYRMKEIKGSYLAFSVGAMVIKYLPRLISRHERCEEMNHYGNFVSSP